MSVKNPTADDARGVAWWNSCDEAVRRYWLELAKSSRPVDAWRKYKQVRKVQRDLGETTPPARGTSMPRRRLP
jgi:hypothetical protein